MKTITLNQLGGFCLILGPALALIFFAIQPGGLFIDSARLTDPAAYVRATASNPLLANLTAMMISLGLIMMVYGMYAVQSSVRDGGIADVLSRAGLTLILFGNLGWVLAQGLTLVMADAQSSQAMQAAELVYLMRLGIVLIFGLAVAAGILVFSLGLAARAGSNKIVPSIVALASLVALVCYIMGISVSGQLDAYIRVARVSYIVWTVWSVMLGVGLLRKDAGNS